MAVMDAAGVHCQFILVLRDVAEEFPARRGAILRQPGRPVPDLARLQIETAVVPSTNQAKLA